MFCFFLLWSIDTNSLYNDFFHVKLCFPRVPYLAVAKTFEAIESISSRYD